MRSSPGIRIHSSVSPALAALRALLVISLVACPCFSCLSPRSAFAAPPPAATVWAVDDGEKIKEDAVSPLPTDRNAVWAPGAPVRLFSVKNETVSFQIVVSADTTPIEGVTVDLEELASDTAKIANKPGASDPTLYI